MICRPLYPLSVYAAFPWLVGRGGKDGVGVAGEKDGCHEPLIAASSEFEVPYRREQ